MFWCDMILVGQKNVCVCVCVYMCVYLFLYVSSVVAILAKIRVFKKWLI